MTRVTKEAVIFRLGMYIGLLVLAAIVWKLEVFIQSRVTVYGFIGSPGGHVSLTDFKAKQLEAYLEMSRLLTTLGTTLLGAMGFLLVTRLKSKYPPQELWAAFACAVCVGLSLYYGYAGYQDILRMLQYEAVNFNRYDISFDRHAHFYAFLLGVFLFTDFAFHNLTGNREDQHERSYDVAGS